MITPDQKLARRQGLGGSDIACIFGKSDYQTPYQLYLEKLGLIESSFDEDNERALWGNLLEPVIASQFSKRNDNVLIEYPDTIVHPFYSFLRANIDGFIPAYNAVLEIKTSGKPNEWGETIPLPYILQIAHYLACTNADKAFVAVLILGNTYKEFIYHRDYKLEQLIIDKAARFWECVQSRVPPPAMTCDDLKLLHPDIIPKKAIIINDDMQQHLDILRDTKIAIKTLDAVTEGAKLELMRFMGDAELLLSPNEEILITHKTSKRGRTFLVKDL